MVSIHYSKNLNDAIKTMLLNQAGLPPYIQAHPKPHHHPGGAQMLTDRKSQERGYADHGWLKSFHSFPSPTTTTRSTWAGATARDQRRPHRPGHRLWHPRPPRHGNHQLRAAGELAHKDSMGNVKGIPPGDVQRMSAGTGVRTASSTTRPTSTTHFLQIWIEPNQRGIEPGYEQKTFADREKRGRLRLVASPDGAEGSVRIHADARAVRRPVRRREAAELAAGSGAQGLCAPGARRA
jgi:quercetin 2,3-dioxygenase